MGSFVWPALLGEGALLNRPCQMPEDSGLTRASGGIHEQPT